MLAGRTNHAGTVSRAVSAGAAAVAAASPPSPAPATASPRLPLQLPATSFLERLTEQRDAASTSARRAASFSASVDGRHNSAAPQLPPQLAAPPGASLVSPGGAGYPLVSTSRHLYHPDAAAAASGGGPSSIPVLASTGPTRRTIRVGQTAAPVVLEPQRHVGTTSRGRAADSGVVVVAANPVRLDVAARSPPLLGGARSRASSGASSGGSSGGSVRAGGAARRAASTAAHARATAGAAPAADPAQLPPVSARLAAVPVEPASSLSANPAPPLATAPPAPLPAVSRLQLTTTFGLFGSRSSANVRPPGPPVQPPPGHGPQEAAATPSRRGDEALVASLSARLRSLPLPGDAVAGPPQEASQPRPAVVQPLPQVVRLREVAPSAPGTAPNSARSSVEECGAQMLAAHSPDALARRAPAPARRPGGGLAGLANLGNTCFMNATLQCLLNTPQLRDYFLGGEWRADLNAASSPTRGELAVAFGRLLLQAWTQCSPEDVVTPSALKAAVAQLAGRRFAGYQQHDSHEFLRFLVEALCDDTSRLSGKKPYRELAAPPDRSDADVSDDWWRYYVSRSQSVVWDVFTGQVLTKVTCGRCGTVHRAMDPIQDVQVDIPQPQQQSLGGVLSALGGSGGAVPLARCLDAFIAPERLVGAEQYHCGVCKAHTDCVKSHELFRLPPVLVLQLKRFATTGWRQRSKLDTPVAVPVRGLDVAPLCAASAPVLRDGRQGATLYDLLAVSCHSGSLSGGHYYAHALNSDSGRWHTFNDSSVSAFDPAALERGSSSAYLLFYAHRLQR